MERVSHNDGAIPFKRTEQSIEKLVVHYTWVMSELKANGIFNKSKTTPANIQIRKKSCKTRITNSTTDRFEYDDSKALPVIEEARQGHPSARTAIAELIAEISERGKPLPPNLALLAAEIMRPDYVPEKKYLPTYNARDEWLFPFISELVERGISPYENGKTVHRAKKNWSACRIILEAMRCAGVNRWNLKTLEDIWTRRRKVSVIP